MDSESCFHASCSDNFTDPRYEAIRPAEGLPHGPRRYTLPKTQDPKTAVVTSLPHGQATRRCPNLHSLGGEGAPGPAATNLELCLGEVRGSGGGGGRDSANMHLGNRAGFDTLNFFGWTALAPRESELDLPLPND